MIALNLLPDIKKEYLKTQKLKRLFIVGALIASTAFVALAILLAIFVFGLQRLQLSTTQADIDNALAELQSIEDLDKIVTIQKQLDAIPQLHDSKPAADRLFGYLETLVPKDISLSKVEVMFEESNLSGELTGTAQSVKAVNVFVDTLKNANFTYEGAEAAIKPFTSVVLSNSTVEGAEVAYTISVKFDALLFDNTLSSAKLTVPNITTTTSVRERPALFDGDSNED